jgi:hypothetical protein
MKKVLSLYIFMVASGIVGQTDYSASWEDFYSYNNVKDFVKVENIIYALADNAVFTYNTISGEVNKLSSVQGLSGESTTAIFYNQEFKRLIIGYENGLVEVVDDDGSITISSDIVNFDQSGEKRINHISEFNGKLFLATPFAIVVYDIKKLEFGDTYFIGNNSSLLEVYQTIIFNGFIYAITDMGLFKANASSDLLIDFNNWQRQFPNRNFEQIAVFNQQLYLVENTKLLLLNEGMLRLERDVSPQNILAIKASTTHLSITLNSSAIILNSAMISVYQFSANTNFVFTLNNAYFEDNMVFLATKELGILSTSTSQLESFVEIHPDGPFSNDIFSITSANNQIWVVYGGYSSAYVPIGNKKGYSVYKNESWTNKVFPEEFPFLDLVEVAIDITKEDKVFICSFAQTNDGNIYSGGGLLEVENNSVINFYNSQNSPIGYSSPSNPKRFTTRISGADFDNQGNLWLADALSANKLKKLSAAGSWTSVDLSSLQTNETQETNILVVDRNNSVWIATRRNGVYVYNENGNRKKVLNGAPNSGSLPDVNVRAIAIDADNRAWIGTLSGLAVYSNAAGIFDDETPNANSIVINGDENGFGERLLGDQTINSIAIDGAENKWFGTDNGGVIYTNPNGQKTLANFSKRNSPLPSNKIVKIAVDEQSGKVYFATDKGIVAYNSKVAPFGENLGVVYAYPNPALKNHEKVTIDGRDGTHLPRGTNVKIIDVSGNLVYETNVVEGQQLQGGKVVWDKKNLVGNPVVSGIYIVLLSNDDASQTSVTKIAIVN